MGTTLRQSVRFIGGGESKAWPLRRVYRETVDLTSKAWIPFPVPQANPSPRASPAFPIATSTDPHDFSEPVSGQRGRGTPVAEAEEVSLLPQAFTFSISFLRVRVYLKCTHCYTSSVSCHSPHGSTYKISTPDAKTLFHRFPP